MSVLNPVNHKIKNSDWVMARRIPRPMKLRNNEFSDLFVLLNPVREFLRIVLRLTVAIMSHINAIECQRLVINLNSSFKRYVRE